MGNFSREIKTMRKKQGEILEKFLKLHGNRGKKCL